MGDGADGGGITVQKAGVDRLKPNAIGLMGVIFVAITGAAPITAMLLNVPFAVGFGSGYYTPAAFLFATVVLVIFSVGYVAMAQHIRAAGGFYAFISHGLGRELGMAAGICGALAYSLFEVSLLGGFAYFANFNILDWGGPDIPWPVLALVAALVINALCFWDIELSVKVLGTALIGEIIILAIFDGAVIGQGGASGVQWESLDPTKLGSVGTGLAAGVGLFLAFWSWVGFEAIPNYAEESKDPKRNVVRGTLISVLALGIGYIITSLAFVSAFNPETLVEDAASAEPAFYVAMGAFGNDFLVTLMQILILTGSFACAMAFHNISSRYFYALGREGILPKALAKLGTTHSKHRSPYIAGAVQTGLAIVIMFVWALFAGFDKPFDAAYVRIYTMMAVQGVVWLLAIQTLCALAVIVWFRKRGGTSNPLVTIVCPLLAIAGQVFAIYLLFANIGTLAGTIAYVAAIKWIAIAGLVVSVGYALLLKKTDRARFDRIGRMIDSGEHR